MIKWTVVFACPDGKREMRVKANSWATADRKARIELYKFYCDNFVILSIQEERN